MVRLFDKVIIIAFVLIQSFNSLAQTDESVYSPKDYKRREQFEKFRKRRIIVSAWQIHQLKAGALVVRLKTNKKLIEALKQQGNETLALQKELEQMAIAKNTMYAYKQQFTFCKVYFMYSQYSDSLLKGCRSGIFLDTNLVVDKSISMNEHFYLIAERDYAYNSSIGYVPEDSARSISETGNPVKEMAVVVKNKYGHQLKSPFPYYVKDKTYVGTHAAVNEKITYNGLKKEVAIGKQFSKEKTQLYVSIFNDNLLQYYQANTAPDTSKIDPSILPFLY